MSKYKVVRIFADGRPARVMQSNLDSLTAQRYPHGAKWGGDETPEYVDVVVKQPQRYVVGHPQERPLTHDYGCPVLDSWQGDRVVLRVFEPDSADAKASAEWIASIMNKAPGAQS